MYFYTIYTPSYCAYEDLYFLLLRPVIGSEDGHKTGFEGRSSTHAWHGDWPGDFSIFSPSKIQVSRKTLLNICNDKQSLAVQVIGIVLQQNSKH